MPQSYIDVEGINEAFLKDTYNLKSTEVIGTIKDVASTESDEVQNQTKTHIDHIINKIKEDENAFSEAGFYINDKTKKLLLKSIKAFDKYNKKYSPINIKELDKFVHGKLYIKVKYGYEFKDYKEYYKCKFKENAMCHRVFSKFKCVLEVLDDKYIAIVFFVDKSTFNSNPQILNVYTVTSENQFDVRSDVLFSQIEYDVFWFDKNE